MRIQTAPNPTPPRNLPSPGPAPDAPPPSPQPPADKVQISKKSFGQKVGASVLPALQAAALGAFASSTTPAIGIALGGLGGMMAGYHLGAGVGSFASGKLAETGAKAGGGGAILGGIGALVVGAGAPVFGTLAGAVGGGVLTHLASPLVAASILGGSAFVGRFLSESA